MNRVYLYPIQYITYGASDVGAIITKPTGAREYKIADHLGSPRVVLDESGTVINQTDYEPFGATVAVTGIDTRKKFIDKEKDRETSLANHGVRQYDPETGSFASIDPKWEKYPNQSPYNYSLNSPLVLVDGNGKNPLFALPLLEWLGLGAAAAGVVYVTLYVASEMRDEYGRFKFPSAPAVSTAVDVPIPSVLPTPDDAGRAFGILIAVLAMNSKEEGPIEPTAPATASEPGPSVVASSKPKDWEYIPAPQQAPMPGLTKAKEKTPKPGGGTRKRWVDEKGNIYEWDYQHGRLEKYNKRGKHLGEIDPETGEQTKPADKTRTIEP